MDLQLLWFPLLLLSFLYLFINKVKNPRPKLPPGPWKLPFIGNLHQLIGSLPHRTLRDLARKYGPLMHLQLGEVSTVIVSSPEMAKEVMKDHDLIFAQRPEFLSAKIITYNYTDIAFSPYGDYWRQLRKICIMELLSSKCVQSFRSLREEEVFKFIRSISTSNGSPINLSEKIFSSTNSVVSRAAFGKKCKDQEEFLSTSKEMTSLGGGFELANVFPSLELLHVITGMKQALESLHKKVDKILDDIVNEHKLKRTTNLTSTNGESPSVEEDLVDVLLRIQESDDLEFPLTDNNIKAVIMDIFVAGTETSSATTEWAMSELMRNPTVMEKAQAELRQVLKGKRKVEETDLQEVTYLKSVIKETLRLHPPLSLLLPRECRERCKINGYEIPIKTKIMVNAWAIGRDPEHWKDAESFYPERFQSSSLDFKGNSFEYIPFGAGRRICPGISFGVAGIELQLAHLLYYFDWKIPGGISPEDLDMSEAFGGTIRRRKDLHLIAIPRIDLHDE